MINCFSVRSSQCALTRQKYYLHSSIKNFELESLATLYNLRCKETNIWLKVDHREVTVELNFKWTISEDYLHLTMPCGMYFTLPKDLIKALLCQHLVNIKIIIHAIITFQTLLTCSDLHKAWLSSYTKTLQRRKMVSCSYTIYRRGQVSKKALYPAGSLSSSQEADQGMSQGLVHTWFHLVSASQGWRGSHPSSRDRFSGGCLFRDKNAHSSNGPSKMHITVREWPIILAEGPLERHSRLCPWAGVWCHAGRRGWAHGEGIWGHRSSGKWKG